SPVDFSGYGDVVQLSVGAKHACVRFADKTAICWGKSNNGQLGWGNSVDFGTTPGQIGANLPFIPLDNVIGMFVQGELFGGCARMQTGDIKCWGRNNHGQLGIGDTHDRGNNANDMGINLPVLDFGANYVVSMSQIDMVKCVVRDSADVVCWGVNVKGLIGREHSVTPWKSPGLPALLGTSIPPVKQVSMFIKAGACVVFRGGTVKCWGLGVIALGYGDTKQRGSAVGSMGDNLPLISFGVPVVSMFGMREAMCYLFTDGRVKCVGLNRKGQLALGTT
ncbi:regulator of chromosome condensation 1/beta-lactamase-inhibitor protein II, partial [Baffinella frigidus]